MQEPTSPTEQVKRRLSKRKLVDTKPGKGETLFCLVNNDGNQIRRPKITISLLDPV